MKPKKKQVIFRSEISVALDNICNDCRRNEKPDIYETTYKPLLLESSHNYRRKSQMLRTASLEQRGKSKTSTLGMSGSWRSDAEGRGVMTPNKQPKSVRSFRYQNSKKEMQAKMRATLRTPSQATTTLYNPTSNPNFNLNLSTSLLGPQDSIRQFLSRLYWAKTRDLHIHPNPKQQKIFISRLQHTITPTEFVASECDFGLCAIQVIVKHLVKNPNIYKLVLDKNPIGDEGVMKLVEILGQMRLKELGLVSVNATSKSGVLLIGAAMGHPTLQIFNISSPEGLNRNRINPQGYSQIKQLLSHPLCKIHTLNLANTGMGQFGFLSFCSGFESPTNGNHYKVINLSHNEISVSEPNSPYVSSCLAKIQVQKLDLQNNHLADLGAKILAHVVGAQYGRSPISASLMSLNLSSNRIKFHGFEQLCNLLPSNKKLTQLSVDNNDLAEHDIFYCTKQLLTYTWSIKKLSLRRTLVASPDSVYHHVKDMADGLLRNKSVRELDLSENCFGVQGVVDVFEAIKDNRTLKMLKLESCGLTDTFIQKIQPIIKQNKSLISLSLCNNSINQKGANILQKILSHCHNITDLNLKKNCINVHLLNSIGYQLRQNKMMVKSQDPEYMYINYIMGLQEDQKKNIMTAINEMSVKKKYLDARGMAIDIVERQERITEREMEIKRENAKISKLEDQIQKEAKEKQKGRKRNTTNIDKETVIEHGESFLVTN